MSKGKCKYCGKEVYEIIYKGDLKVVVGYLDEWMLHTCSIKDVKK